MDGVALLLGGLAMFGPFSIDTIFPAFPAIGAQLGCPDALCIDIAGEASIQMNIQELGTATQYRLPVKIFILNNEYMGMVRQWQDLTYGGRYAESYSDSLPDFVKLAEGMGCDAVRVTKSAELADAYKRGLSATGASLIEVMVDSAVPLLYTQKG